MGTPINLEDIDRRLGLVIQSAWAESTLKTRNSQWSRFITFCYTNGMEPLPANVITVARFLIDLASTCAFSTCNNYLSAIVMLHKFFGYEVAFRDSFVIMLVLKGLGRKIGKQVSQKA